MPLHDLGYRAWQGRLEPQRRRWWVIAQTSARLAWGSRWLRRLMLIAWLPMVYMGAGFFFYEQWVASPEYRQTASTAEPVPALQHEEAFLMPEDGRPSVPPPNDAPPQQPRHGRSPAQSRGNDIRTAMSFFTVQFPELRGLLSEGAVGETAAETARAAARERHRVWSWLLSTFFRYPQGVLLMLVVGLIAPPLVAQDVRSRAFLLYFSRPLVRVEYILGKAAAVTGYVLMITTLPALVLYILGLLLSPGLNVVLHTWDLPLRILAASIVVIVPTVSLALAFSSLTSESRYAGFAWFAMWVLSWVAYIALMSAMPAPQKVSYYVAGEPVYDVTSASDRWSVFSLYHTLGKVQNWVFGFETDKATLLRAILMLTGVTVVSWIVLFRRVSSPMRI